MVYSRICILILIFSLEIGNLCSQEVKDTLLGNFDYDVNKNSVNLDLIALETGYLFLNVEYIRNDFSDLEFSIIETDFNFNIVNGIDELRLNGEEVNEAYFKIHNKENNEIILMSNIPDDNINKYVSYALDLSTYDIEIRDTLPDSSTESFSLVTLKKRNNFYEGFGAISSGLDGKNYYTKLTPEGKFLDYKVLDNFDNFIYTLTHEYIDGSYILSTWYEDFHILDSGFNIVQKVKTNFTVEINGISTTNLLAARYMKHVPEADKIICIGRTISGGPYSISKVDLPIYRDSIGKVSNPVPLLTGVDYDEFTQSTFTHVDSEGNIVSLLTGDYYPFDNHVDTNALYIVKMDSNYNEIWTRVFSDQTELEVRDFIIDLDDNLVIFGEQWKPIYSQNNTSQNFYLKIFSDGKLSTATTENPITQDVRLYPNPTSGLLQVKNSNMNASSYHIYNIHGQLVKECKYSSADRIDITEVPAGIYFVRFYNGSSEAVYQSKVVKY